MNGYSGIDQLLAGLESKYGSNSSDASLLSAINQFSEIVSYVSPISNSIAAESAGSYATDFTSASTASDLGAAISAFDVYNSIATVMILTWMEAS
ncbi:hypothetical protein [Secundilactobacillus odoratitofui]|uniref:hypothetical protein n=1 Tax=Secundilactobacillus odoratitofui TaxID=480930 RepID=UPI000A5831A9|nr:hypothetical protein [Secundilactobacillus odoratitofui]